MADSLPPETLAWLRQCAALDGAAYPQVLLHLLKRVEALDKDSIEQSKSNSFCFEAVIKRLEKLEAAQQHDTLLIGGPQDKLDRLIELDRKKPMQQLTPDSPRYIRQRDNEWQGADHQNGPWRPIPAPQSGLPWMKSAAAEESSVAQPLSLTPEAAPVATDEELCRVYDDGPTSFAPALRAIYNLGRQHGAAQRLEQETDR
jgi:hypothetical protein